MQNKILITGKPKSGKSTLLKKLIEAIPNKVGFVTNEILGETGRLGFEIETHLGTKATLAHVDFQTEPKVSKYGVSIKNLESMLPEVFDFKKSDFLHLDEIGQMELFSERFKALALRYLDSQNPCLITLTAIFDDAFIQAIKKRDDILLIELTPENRKEKEALITNLLKKPR
ncbi:MAG: hypothetical protein RLZZ347_442 [Candidatus Parcubacteria bacterium]|jgi:nucleoside-triphosphatase THEP1